MSRLLLLAILVLWMSPRENVSAPAWPAGAGAGVFLGGYAALVLGLWAWGRGLAARVADAALGRTLDRYNRATEIARYLVPAWFAVGVFALGWGHVVYDALAWSEPAGIGRLPAGKASEPYWRIPGLLLGTLPAFAAWMGLWWAQYPAERALKEQSVLYHANEGLPIHAPPGFATFFVEHFRQQLLFTIAPILLIVAARDLLAAGYLLFGSRPLGRNGGDLLILPVAALIFVLAPEILRRVIPTKPLPPNWPLRRRLEALCQRAGLRYRDILLWQTNSSMGNAMVMGLFPRVRYVFLSDLLLETMRDEEIEAVFAHELGHIVHRHMWWYVVFFVTLMLFLVGPVSLALNEIPALSVPPPGTMLSPAEYATANERGALQGQVLSVLGLALFVLLFGYLSRRFERQADVYAARTMQAAHETGGGGDRPAVVISHVNPESDSAGFLVHGLAAAGAPAVAAGGVPLSYAPSPAFARAAGGGRSYVGEHGAGIVGAALRRVATINNIPVAAREWLHGSIASRIRYLHELSADAGRTARFDRYMRRLYWALVAIFVTFAAWLTVQVTLIEGATRA
jgi:STE24 endopeptidase